MIKGLKHGGRRAAAPQLCGVILAMICTALTTGCQRATEAVPEINVKEAITPQPPHVGPATVSIELSDPLQKPVSHAAIMVEADMSHPGMRPVFAEARETVPGSYRALIEFSMAGDWVVLFHIKLADRRRVEHQMDVRGVQQN